MKRCLGGRPLDHSLTRRVQGLLGRLPPFLQAKILDHALDQRMHQSFPEIDPHWRLSPAPPDSNSTAIFNERFIPLMGSGAIRSVSGIARFTESGFETDDGRNIKIDAIIFASGYRFDYSILSREADPTSRQTPEWDSSPHFNGLPYPWLYQTLFSTGYADSLAFIGPCAGYTFATFKHADLASQAIAQVWRGSFTLPSKREMDDWCETNYRRSLGSIKSHHVPKTGSDARKLERWLNQVAGNGLDARLGWGTEGWELWWKDRELYKLLTNGVDTPFAQRLFDGRLGSRMRWEGARRAIYRANGRNYHGVKEVEVEGDSERVEGDATAAG